jgi:hypothetical protein
MMHVTSHGRYGESVLIYGPDVGEVEFEIMEYQAANAAAVFGPTVLRVTGDFGACGHTVVPPAE